jgi:hypothetical protein
MGPASPAFDRWQIIWAKADVCGLLAGNLHIITHISAKLEAPRSWTR